MLGCLLGEGGYMNVIPSGYSAWTFEMKCKTWHDVVFGSGNWFT